VAYIEMPLDSDADLRARADELACWLRTNGHPTATTHDPRHPDQITGTPGVTWLIKTYCVEPPTPWMTELETARREDDNPVGVIVNWRLWHPPKAWWAWLPLDTLAWMCNGGSGADPTPVRVSLGDLVRYLPGYTPPTTEDRS